MQDGDLSIKEIKIKLLEVEPVVRRKVAGRMMALTVNHLSTFSKKNICARSYTLSQMWREASHKDGDLWR